MLLRKKTNLTSAVLIVALMSSGSAFAARVKTQKVQTNSAQVSTTTAPQFEKSFTSYYWTEMNGPSLGNFGGNRSDAYGKENVADPIFLDNELYLNYKVSEQIQFGPELRFLYMPSDEAQATLIDPRVGIWGFNLIQDGRYTLSWVTLRTTVPVTESSRDAKILATPNLVATQKLHLGGRWDLKLYSSFKWTIYSQDSEATTDFNIYLWPYVDYHASDVVTLRGKFLTGMFHQRGAKPADFDPEGSTAFQTQVIWQVAKDFSFEPYLRFNTGGSLAPGATTTGFEVNATFF